MTSVFIKRLQKYFLHLRKIQQDSSKVKDCLKVGNYTTLGKGETFSIDHGPVVVSDSEDETENASISKRRTSLLTRKSISRGNVVEEREEDRSPSSCYSSN
jgi:hypothetical protein